MTRLVERARALVHRRPRLGAPTVALFEHLPLLLVLGLAFAVYLIARSLFPGPEIRLSPGDLLPPLLLGAVVLGTVVTAYPLLRLVQRRSGRAGDRGWRDFAANYITARQLWGLVLVLLWVVVFLRCFDAMKAYIPIVVPFRWDELFMSLDHALHGAHPWEALHRWIGSPSLTLLMDRLYFSWFGAGVLFLGFEAWNPSRRSRFRYFVTFAAVWFVLGNLLATIGSSAGPLFYDRIGAGGASGGDPFAGLVAHLRRVDAVTGLHVWEIQRSLWTNYLNLPAGGAGSISAMPSVHVAVAALMGFAGFEVNRVVGWVAWIYALVILFGSVYLGWHYAVDGYVAIGSTYLLWVGAGSFTEWYWRTVLVPLERAREARR